MSLTYRMGAALFAVALSACAHNVSSIDATPNYAGGRAAQPGGWLPEQQRAAHESTPLVAHDGRSYLGGRASNPNAWLASDAPPETKVATASCKSGGRAAQPFSGPSQYLAVEPTPKGTVVTCRTTSATKF